MITAVIMGNPGGCAHTVQLSYHVQGYIIRDIL